MEQTTSMAIAKVAPSDIHTIATFHDFNYIWKTTNGGTSWTDITGSLPTGSNNITYIAIKKQ